MHRVVICLDILREIYLAVLGVPLDLALLGVRFLLEVQEVQIYRILPLVQRVQRVQTVLKAKYIMT